MNYEMNLDNNLQRNLKDFATNKGELGLQFTRFDIEQNFGSNMERMPTDTETVNEDRQLSSFQENKNQDRKQARNTFPWKLHNMLDDAQRDGKQDIVGWEPDGLSFRVLKPKEFEKSIMPKYFNHSSFRSFQRQLYHYKFERVTEGPSRGAYFHPQFNQHDKSVCPKSVKKLRSEARKRRIQGINSSLTKHPLHGGQSRVPTNHKTRIPSHLLMQNSKTQMFNDPSSNIVEGFESEVSFDANFIQSKWSVPPSLTKFDQYELSPEEGNQVEFPVNDIYLDGKFTMLQGPLHRSNFVDIEPIPIGQNPNPSVTEMIDHVHSLLANCRDTTSANDETSSDPFSSFLHIDIEPTPLPEPTPSQTYFPLY